jgi:multicomponent Na+:H+ antiporter subunit F
VNVWLIGATVLLAGLLPCFWVCTRATPMQALVALELGTTLTTLALLLLAEGFQRSSYFVLPLVLPGLALVGGLVFIRFLGSRSL